MARPPRPGRRLRLNAPYGARCFLTLKQQDSAGKTRIAGLNAPYGARCFLTEKDLHRNIRAASVLMHLMALGAF